MRTGQYLTAACVFLLQTFIGNAWSGCSTCMMQGGIHYCDSSSGRYVCKNGEYSPDYCTRHAVMELEKLQGCCLWHGGVFKITPRGVVICEDGSLAEMCTRENRFLSKYSQPPK